MWCVSKTMIVCAFLLFAWPTHQVQAGQAAKKPDSAKTQIIGNFPNKIINENGNGEKYSLIEEGNKFRLRVLGPLNLVILVRGLAKTQALYTFELDGQLEDQMGINLVANASRGMFLQVPTGEHELVVIPSVKTLLRVVQVKRTQPIKGEVAVGWQEKKKDPIALVVPQTAADKNEPPLVKISMPPEPLASSAAASVEKVAPVKKDEPAIQAEPPPSTPISSPQRAREPYVGLGLLLDFMITTGKPSSTSLQAGELSPSGSHGLGIPLLFSFRGYIPAGELITIVPGVDIGWYRLSGSGETKLPNDPDFGTFGYSWTNDNMPIFAGVAVALKPLRELPLFVSLGGGFSAVYAHIESTYQKEGVSDVTDAPQSDWGIGYYIGIEGAYVLGPGRITLEYRYSSARTDMNFQDIYDGSAYNREPGDLEGSNIIIGYRFDL